MVINNSVDFNVFFPCNRNEMRKKYDLDVAVKVFVFISLNIDDPNKGLDLLSMVLLELDPSIEILAIGANPKKREWKNVRSVGLVKNQHQMCELLSCANYMAMPSFQEAFSQSPIEAMACGLPVVAFPVSGTSELINKNNGVICEEFTLTSLRKGIEQLMTTRYNPEIIRQYVIDRFAPDIIAGEYIALYKRILSIED